MILAYLRERFRASLFVPVAAVIGAAASASAPFDFWKVAQDTAFVWLLLLQCRLWDDLVDRDSDAVSHPDRVLVRVTSVRPFVRLCAVLALLNTTITVGRDDSGLAASTLLLLHAVLAGLYVMRSRRSLVADQLLLAKYPAFVLVVAGDRAIAAPMTTAIVASAIYAAASIYEAWHDPASPVGTLLGGRS